MSTSSQDREHQIRHFMDRGVQYYVAARSAAWAGLLPVCGNLYHHSVEMFLKGSLSQTQSLNTLKNLSHKLIHIWEAFKAEFPSSAGLQQFDAAIADIAEFEEIRYPDKILKNGAQMLVDWGSGPSQPAQMRTPSPKLYKLNANDMDRLISEIFVAASKNPLFFTSGLKPDVQEMLARDNPVATQLLGK
jgi:hypothetical protein